MRRMRVCWAQGAAQGVWKEITRRVVVGREEVCDEKSSGVLISLRVDMMQETNMPRGQVFELK